jgi:hypothetical protein
MYFNVFSLLKSVPKAKLNFILLQGSASGLFHSCKSRLKEFHIASPCFLFVQSCIPLRLFLFLFLNEGISLLTNINAKHIATSLLECSLSLSVWNSQLNVNKEIDAMSVTSVEMLGYLCARQHERVVV